jgi:hypothetical protein
MNEGNENNDEPSIEKMILNRQRFSRFVNDVVDANIENEIYNFVKNINGMEENCASIYGGRNWSHLLSPYDEQITNPLERVSFLKGNFDILVITNDEFNLATKPSKTKKTKKTGPEYNEIQTVIDVMCINIRDTLNTKLDAMNLNDQYEFKYTKYLPYSPRTICKIAQSYVIEVVVKGKGSNSYQLSESKMFLYVEYGILNNNRINAHNFKTFFLDGGGNNCFLNHVGLFIISNFIQTSRVSEKGVDIDNVRGKLFDEYLLPEMLERDPDENTSIQNFCVNFMYRHFRDIFNINYYEITFTSMMQKFMSKYNAQIINANNVPINYDDFWNYFNSDYLLNMPQGGTKAGHINERKYTPDYTNETCNFPSLRQLIKIILTQINNYEKDVSVQLAGGDAMRRIMPEGISYTSDIDAKIFTRTYLKKKGQKNHTYDLRLVIYRIALYLNAFMNYFSYFRFVLEYGVRFGDYSFTLQLNTSNQEFISSARILFNFTVQLTSIDTKIHFVLIPIDNPADVFKGKYKFSPLDLVCTTKHHASKNDMMNSINTTLSTVNMPREKINNLKNNDRMHSTEYGTSFINCQNNSRDDYLSSIKVPNSRDNYYINPINIKNLYNDLSYNVHNNKKKLERVIAGKHEKDILRLEMFNNTLSEACGGTDINEMTEDEYKTCFANILERNVHNGFLENLEQLYTLNNPRFKQIFDIFAENIKIIIQTRSYDNLLNPLTGSRERQDQIPEFNDILKISETKYINPNKSKDDKKNKKTPYSINLFGLMPSNKPNIDELEFEELDDINQEQILSEPEILQDMILQNQFASRRSTRLATQAQSSSHSQPLIRQTQSSSHSQPLIRQSQSSSSHSQPLIRQSQSSSSHSQPLILQTPQSHSPLMELQSPKSHSPIIYYKSTQPQQHRQTHRQTGRQTVKRRKTTDKDKNMNKSIAKNKRNRSKTFKKMRQLGGYKKTRKKYKKL